MFRYNAILFIFYYSGNALGVFPKNVERHFCINLLNILAFFYWQRITVQDDYFFEKVIAWTFT